MNNIVFVGNSLAAVKAIEEIRKTNQTVGITIVTEGFYPYDREKLFSYLGREIKEKQTLCHPEGFYHENNVRVIADKTVARFNFKRGQVFFENKEQLEYDVLVLADVGAPRLPAIKGSHKEGVYSAARLKDVKTIAEQIQFGENVLIQLSSLPGFRTLCALSGLGKEIVVSAPSSVLFQGLLDAESSSILKQLLEQSGIRLMLDNPIEEILGDAEAKAVRLKSGKVFAADMIILDDLRLDTRIIKESGLEFAWSDNHSYRTNFSNVYVADAFFKSFTDGETESNSYATPSAVLYEQGQAIGREIAGQAGTIEHSPNVTTFQLKGLRGFWLGKAYLQEGGREFLKFDASKNVYKKIFANDTHLSGAVFFNAEEGECSAILDVFEKKLNIQGVEERLLEGNLDVAELSKSQQS
jgi:nitrite reductase (NADH) large subunit